MIQGATLDECGRPRMARERIEDERLGTYLGIGAE
jgi:hypothetical protein